MPADGTATEPIVPVLGLHWQAQMFGLLRGPDCQPGVRLWAIPPLTQKSIKDAVAA